MAAGAKTKIDTSMVSSSSRPMRLRMRKDVTAQKQSYQGRDYWVIKDPISLKYYRFEEEEYALLLMLDGNSSPDQIKRRFDFQFAPQKITLQELFQFVGLLYRSCLLVSDSPNQGIELKKRGEKNRSNQFRSKLTNVLAIRFKGFDPDGALTLLNKWTWWFFTWPCFILVLILGGSAAGLLFANFELFQNKLPSFQEFFAAKNWFLLAIVMGLTKVFHEFGHGLACKRFGSQCHEMGVMLLVLTPCLYCNVSDSWTLPSKWKRAFIAAAGMYVELVLASCAVFVWWMSQPGMVNQLALNIVFICSVSTLLFNANPLLRYDGYYILSDLLEIPNLRQKATTILQRTAAHWLLGIESKPDPFLPPRKRWFFACYAVAAALYRWVITFAIFWFLYGLLEPYGLKIIGQLIALTAIYGLIGMPLIQLWRFFQVPGRIGTVKPLKISLATAGIVGTLAAILLIPIPRHVYCSFYVQPKNGQNLFVDVPGELITIESVANRQVSKGQPIMRLRSRKLEAEIREMDVEVRVSQIRFATYQKASQMGTPEAAAAANQRETILTELETAQKRLNQRKVDLDRLTIYAPIDGVLLDPERVDPHQTDSGSLGEWDGSPLDAKNVGAYLDQKTLVGKIVPDMSQVEALLVVDQSEIEFVHPGLDVELLVDHLPNKLIEGTTQEISSSKFKRVPKQLSNKYGGDLVTTTDKDGLDVPQTTHYVVRVPLENVSSRILPGATGTAKICTGSQSIGYRLWRLTMQTFRFDL